MMKKKNLFVNILFYSLVVLNFGSKVFAGDIALDGAVTDTLSTITRILFIVGAGVCVFKCIQIGIMYTISSAADKSNAKSAILPWIIGTFVCFGAATIGNFIIDLIGGSLKDKPVLNY